MIFFRTIKALFTTYRRYTLSVLAILFIAWWFCLPRPLFKDPLSIVLEDNKGALLGARIAEDGQWRFPFQETVPKKFEQAIITFEDKRFYKHPGVDLIALLRATQQNLKKGKVVSGGSTLSMQLIRLSRKGKPRTVFQKFVEMIKATRLEVAYSKTEILARYAAYAPMGGNVVGIEAASWRYFGKSAQLLSWAEAAMLAVLPNSPSLIHPGKNRKALFDKRNRLLKKMQEAGIFDESTYQLAILEPIPQKPVPLPRLAPHLLDRAAKEIFTQQNQRTKIQTTIDRSLQKNLNEIVKNHHRNLSGNNIHNLAAMVIEVETGNIIAYVGNVPGTGGKHSEAVDITAAPRSTGSILKPFLYAVMLDEGELLPGSFVSDIPIYMNGYRPENFYPKYDGLVPADQALSRSLNVPFVRMLQDHGIEKFHHHLQKLGLTTITQSPDHYGLPLILGGAEAKLYDLTNTYACMSRTLANFQKYDGRYDEQEFRKANYLSAIKVPKPSLGPQHQVVSASAIYSTFEAMRRLERPTSSGQWEQFTSSHQIAWKTGTSFGFRDAWAIGTTSKYTVGVWVGNADGEGRRGLVGVKAAAPVLFDIFELLPASNWFERPYDEMRKIPTCQISGLKASKHCPVDSSWVPLSGLKTEICKYHQLIHLDDSEQYQVNSDCYSPSEMKHRPWLVLPALEAHYYQTISADFQPLPPFRSDCNKSTSISPMQFIYPDRSLKIYVPVDLDGQLSRTVFKVAHRDMKTEIHWHLDNEYIGSTQDFHHLEMNPTQGKHLLTIVDEKGERLSRHFEILAKE